MNTIKGLIFIFIVLSSSCDFVKRDITIIHETQEPLYFYIHQYKSENGYPWNIAYIWISRDKYEINFDHNKNKISAKDSLSPTIVNQSWQQLASEKDGLTILFYKRHVLESLPQDTPLTEEQI